MIEPPDNKTWTKTITGFVVSAVSAIVLAGINHYSDIFFKNRGNDKGKVIVEVNRVLDKYAQGLNTHSFNAYDVFSNPVEEFITMKNTSPAEINGYINHYYYRQFLKPTVTFDKQSVIVNYVDDNSVQVDVVENDEYIKPKANKVEQHQTKVRIYFTKDYKIKVFTLYKIIF